MYAPRMDVCVCEFGIARNRELNDQLSEMLIENAAAFFSLMHFPLIFRFGFVY